MEKSISVNIESLSLNDSGGIDIVYNKEEVDSQIDSFRTAFCNEFNNRDSIIGHLYVKILTWPTSTSNDSKFKITSVMQAWDSAAIGYACYIPMMANHVSITSIYKPANSYARLYINLNPKDGYNSGTMTLIVEVKIPERIDNETIQITESHSNSNGSGTTIFTNEKIQLMFKYYVYPLL